MNVRFQCEVFDKLMDDGIVWPAVPLWTHFQHVSCPRPYEHWIAYDKALLHLYDACVRLTAINPKWSYSQQESSGADGEVEEFNRLGKPVFQSIEAMYAWARDASRQQ